MNSEIVGLFDLAQLREIQLQQERAVRRRVLAVVVAAQWRRKAFQVMQQAVEGWREVREGCCASGVCHVTPNCQISNTWSPVLWSAAVGRWLARGVGGV